MGANHSYKQPTILDFLQTKTQTQVIQYLRAHPSQINAVASGRSVFCLSLELGYAELFKFCFESNANFEPPIPRAGSFLHRSVELSNYSFSKYLLRNARQFGLHKDKTDLLGRTPLHTAVSIGSPEMVALLLKYNADRNLQDKSGRSPIDYAFDSDLPSADEIIEQFSIEDSLQKPLREKASNKRDMLQVALQQSKIPVIPSSELEFGEVINKGSSCLVFKGKWRGSEIAIKQFKIEYSLNEKELQKFIKEMQVLAQVRHPQLLLLMGIAMDQPNLCLVTEYVPYSSLFHVLHKNKHKKISLNDRFHISLQIAQGLAYLHANKPPIIHRDLKPENCLLDNAMNLKIADFGLARPITSFESKGVQLSTTVCIGTTRFMAPELFDHDLVDSIGTEVDIWALGCMLIEVFSNKRPWHYISSANSSSIFYEIFYRKPIPIPENVPPEVSDVIQECCRYNPMRRPNIEEVLKKLEAAKRLYVLAKV